VRGPYGLEPEDERADRVRQGGRQSLAERAPERDQSERLTQDQLEYRRRLGAERYARTAHGRLRETRDPADARLRGGPA
jgi:hypothetical protein